MARSSSRTACPGTETQTFDRPAARKNFPEVTGPTATIVFHPRRGVSLTDWRVALQVGKAIQQVGALPRVASVENPYGGTGGAKGRNAVVAVAHLKGSFRDLGTNDLNELQEATEPARLAGVDVDFGGIASMVLNQPEAGPGEGVGVFLALGVLLFAFGSLLAAGVPIVVSLCAMAIAYSLIHFGASIWQIHPTAPMVAAMLGLGADIDYALFVVTRHRRQLADGMDVESSTAPPCRPPGTPWSSRAARWSSRSAGCGSPASPSSASSGSPRPPRWPSSSTASLTLLPAVLAALGTRIDRYKLPRIDPDAATDRWERWGRHVDRECLAVHDRGDAGPALPRDPDAQPAVRHHGRQHAAALRQRAPRLRRDRQGVRAGLVQPVRRWWRGYPRRRGRYASRRAPRPPRAGWSCAEPGGRLAVSPNDRPAPDPEARRLGEELRNRIRGVPGRRRRGGARSWPATRVIVKVVPATAPQAAATANLVHDLRGPR